MKRSTAAAIIVASLSVHLVAQGTIRPDPDGVYRIRNLPPGEYLAAAVPALSLPIDGEWDPSFVEKVRPAAIGFKLAEGQSLALNLTLTE